MEVTKITEKFTFYKEGTGYILKLGKIKMNDDRNVIFRVTEIDVKDFGVIATCGCTAIANKEISPTEMEIEINYKNCDATFAKTVKLVNRGIITLLKIKGACTK